MEKLKESLFIFGNRFILFAVVLVAGALVAKILLGLIKKMLLKSKLDHTAKTFLFSLIRVALYSVVTATALGSAGIDISSLITALGAAAITAGLAMQDTLKNLVSGFIILINKPFTAGDLIEIEGTEGFVDSIRIFYTRIHTFDNKAVQIPNSKLTSACVVNCSLNETRRVGLKFTVSYEDSLAKVKSVIYDVIAKNEMILTDPEPKVYISNHLDSGVEVTVFVWGMHDDYFPILFYMEENVKLAFDENGITIPYPHVQLLNNK